MTQWWIDKGRLLGSSNPTIDELRELYSRGFRTIISLIEQGIERPKYDVDVAKAVGFKLHSIPIQDFGAPTIKKFEEFLGILKRTPSSEMILVHCGGGQGRTGTMGAAYWIEKDQNLTAEEAIHKIRLAYWTERGLSVTQAEKKIRSGDKGAVETLDQERSLHDLEVHLRSRETR